MNKKEYKRQWNLNNKDKVRKHSLKCKYNITQKQYDDLLLQQDNCCAICNEHKDTFLKGVFIDHCHVTKKVRGLLCTNCNTAIGLLHDNVNKLSNAINYLNKKG